MAKSVKKRRNIKIFTNLQITITAILGALWIAYFSEDVNVHKFRVLQNELDSLTFAADSIKATTYKDSIRLQQLRNDDAYLEKYARETFYMHRKDEEVYVAE